MEKFKNLLKRESFYVVLFVCLLLITTVAIYTGGKKATKETQKPVANNTVPEDKSTTNNTLVPDAELVKKEEEKVNAKEEKKNEASNEEGSVATSAKPTKEFINPVEKGLITRTFNIAPRLENDGKVANVYKGIDIEVPVGTEVKSATDGTVLEAKSGDSKIGNYVLVECANGVKILYGNLDKSIKVKAGDKITQGAVIGKVGNSIKMNPKDRVSKEYLLLHVEKDKEPINPTKYFKEIAIKK
ncbi:M23 family metallopeptidase [Clostridium massiliamazoniense]|uniref:M23 family metallopeptidase n=1 Tax=Clostridium massiliamazoniense TaxID=1347366 RepID=UPI0006D7693B|nr:M23 family metallopeptidase [Clostridium massiliamazoniense]